MGSYKSFIERLVEAINDGAPTDGITAEWRERFKPTDEWNFKAKPGVGGGFVAWCAKTADLGNSPLDMPFGIEVHFEFGATADEAILKLKREVLS